MIFIIEPFWYASLAYRARLVQPWVFWLDTRARPFSPDMPPKRSKKVRLGINASIKKQLACSSCFENFLLSSNTKKLVLIQHSKYYSLIQMIILHSPCLRGHSENGLQLLKKIKNAAQVVLMTKHFTSLTLHNHCARVTTEAYKLFSFHYTVLLFWQRFKNSFFDIKRNNQDISRID